MVHEIPKTHNLHLTSRYFTNASNILTFGLATHCLLVMINQLPGYHVADTTGITSTCAPLGSGVPLTPAPDKALENGIVHRRLLHHIRMTAPSA